MLDLFNQFGRSRELRCLDQELRAAGVHPVLVPEAVKLAALRLLEQPPAAAPHACAEAARLLAYCILGPEAFSEANDPDLAAATEQRVWHAIEAGDSLDARFILLALHAGLVGAVVRERYGLELG